MKLGFETWFEGVAGTDLLGISPSAPLLFLSETGSVGILEPI